MTDIVDLGNGWVQYYCQFCGRGPTTAMKESWAGRLRSCVECLRRASASETLKRLSPINDPLITEALKEIE